MDKKRILIIGDSCDDVFIYGKVDRLSPEGPAPVFLPLETVRSGGMAKNVGNNVIAMGAIGDVFTNYTQMKKIRYVEKNFNYLFLRVDDGDSCERINLDELPDLSQYEAIIISDYCKGFLDEDSIEWIAKKHPLVIMDTKRLLGEWANSVAFIKINQPEYMHNLHILNNMPYLMDKVIVTKGERGCEFRGKQYPVQTVEVKDVSGAGDTFIAGFTYKYVTEGNVDTAIEYANQSASNVVRKRGVTTV